MSKQQVLFLTQENNYRKTSDAFMYVKMFLICVSSDGLKDSERDMRMLNFLLQGRSMCGFFPHSVNYSCLWKISVYLPSFEG